MELKKEKFLNTYINNIAFEETIKTINDMVEKDKKSYIVPINVDVVMKIEEDKYLKQIVDEADLVLIDGQPLIWISKFYKRPIKEKISGSDLVPKICEIGATKGYSFFILGGKEGVAEKAKSELNRKYSGIKVVGTYAPPLGFENDEEEINKINNLVNNSRADILIVCLGCPKQEKWIYENIKKYNAKLSICAGATVDFMAGNIKRAPIWMSNHGLEWLYRFIKEPKRLFKRYFIEDTKIIKLIIKYR